MEHIFAKKIIIVCSLLKLYDVLQNQKKLNCMYELNYTRSMPKTYRLKIE